MFPQTSFFRFRRSSNAMKRRGTGGVLPAAKRPRKTKSGCAREELECAQPEPSPTYPSLCDSESSGDRSPVRSRAEPADSEPPRPKQATKGQIQGQIPPKDTGPITGSSSLTPSAEALPLSYPALCDSESSGEPEPVGVPFYQGATKGQDTDPITEEPLVPSDAVTMVSPDGTARLSYNVGTLLSIAKTKGRWLQPPHFREEMTEELLHVVWQVRPGLRGARLGPGELHEAELGGDADLFEELDMLQHRHLDSFQHILDRFTGGHVSRAPIYVCRYCYETAVTARPSGNDEEEEAEEEAEAEAEAGEEEEAAEQPAGEEEEEEEESEVSIAGVQDMLACGNPDGLRLALDRGSDSGTESSESASDDDTSASSGSRSTSTSGSSATPVVRRSDFERRSDFARNPLTLLWGVAGGEGAVRAAEREGVPHDAWCSTLFRDKRALKQHLVARHSARRDDNTLNELLASWTLRDYITQFVEGCNELVKKRLKRYKAKKHNHVTSQFIERLRDYLTHDSNHHFWHVYSRSNVTRYNVMRNMIENAQSGNDGVFVESGKDTAAAEEVQNILASEESSEL